MVSTMRRYKNAPITELTMATMANQYELASTDADAERVTVLGPSELFRGS